MATRPPKLVALDHDDYAARYVPTPAKYAGPKTSGLSYEIPSGGGTLDIELK